MKNISIRLDEELLEGIDLILRKHKTKRSLSSIISDSLYEYIICHYSSLIKTKKNKLGASILSQLRLKKDILKDHLLDV
ncbi:MAG: hypothetical protein EU549_04920 [Promethearchaeota archaeon]|nr:MAG: hypothetical protein EU549_04920 [Candidatus Lokiarchaeota archaeon]